MDSAMVYRGMDIGTAKPSLAVRQQVPHHLIDILDPTESYSAGRFRNDALQALELAHSRGRIPVITGGTLLYLRALSGGLADIPEADPAVRAVIDQQAAASGWPAMHARLAAIDPVAAGRIAPADRQRIQRALEVFELTGRTLTSLQASRGDQPSISMQTFALIPGDRARLAAGIAERFDAMVRAGFVDEVRSLWRRGDVTASTPAIRAVGYRQIWSYLAGECDWALARDRAIVATRRLAKRQLTWLRSESAIGHRLGAMAAGDGARAEEALDRVLSDWG